MRQANISLALLDRALAFVPFKAWLLSVSIRYACALQFLDFLVTFTSRFDDYSIWRFTAVRCQTKALKVGAQF